MVRIAAVAVEAASTVAAVAEAQFPTVEAVAALTVVADITNSIL